MRLTLLACVLSFSLAAQTPPAQQELAVLSERRWAPTVSLSAKQRLLCVL